MMMITSIIATPMVLVANINILAVILELPMITQQKLNDFHSIHLTVYSQK
jgi:hypothetical protein